MMINQYLKNAKELDDHTIHLLFSANRWEKHREILDDLNNGITLVVDRYAYSGAAFSGAKKVFRLIIYLFSFFLYLTYLLKIQKSSTLHGNFFPSLL